MIFPSQYCGENVVRSVAKSKHHVVSYGFHNLDHFRRRPWKISWLFIWNIYGSADKIASTQQRLSGMRKFALGSEFACLLLWTAML